jgi:hypothetical protein
MEAEGGTRRRRGGGLARSRLPLIPSASSVGGANPKQIRRENPKSESRISKQIRISKKRGKSRKRMGTTNEHKSQRLAAWLASGPIRVYSWFSILIENGKRLTSILVCLRGGASINRTHPFRQHRRRLVRPPTAWPASTARCPPRPSFSLVSRIFC